MKVVTHNGSFHADDVFAFAVLSLAFGEKIELARTRDPEVISSGDIVFDVGRIYDPVKKRFDHHQEGGAGARNNGIPYASFGLVWKEYGSKICSVEEAEIVDRKLASVIDASDNGVDLYKPIYPDTPIYTVSSIIGSLNKTSLEADKSDDEMFQEAVKIAKIVLDREIMGAKEYIFAENLIKEAYENAEDKRLIIVGHDIKRGTINNVMTKYPDSLYIVKPHGKVWSVGAFLKNPGSFETRKPLPKAWAGKTDEELQKVTGVNDAIFCHNGRFVANAASKEGALQLAKLALSS